MNVLQKITKKQLAALAVGGAVISALVAAPVVAQRTTTARNPEAEATYRDIQNTLGVVPEFMRMYPEFAIQGAWEEMKGVALNPNTALTGKQKELIGLAVAAQVPCNYCVYFHTETAKLNGATEAEIKHVLAEASLTRHWSTIVNGMNQEEGAFRSEVARLVDFAKKNQSVAPPPGQQRGQQQGRQKPAAPRLTDAQSALRDIEATLGFVPTFLRAMPPEGLVGAWRLYKNVEVDPAGPLDPKTLSLTSLAVASQIPCKFCVIADTEFAKLGGATDREIREAVAVAAIVRHWSTFLNGAMVDEARFRRDVDLIVSTFKESEARRAAGR
jgi:AhpD family alkylhydroperoxidase